jgi:hypothetical protein
MSFIKSDKASIVCLIGALATTIVIIAVVAVVSQEIGAGDVTEIDAFHDVTGNFSQRIANSFNNSLLTLHVTGAFLSQTSNVTNKMFVAFLNESMVTVVVLLKEIVKCLFVFSRSLIIQLCGHHVKKFGWFFVREITAKSRSCAKCVHKSV